MTSQKESDHEQGEAVPANVRAVRSRAGIEPCARAVTRIEQLSLIATSMRDLREGLADIVGPKSADHAAPTS